MEPSNVRVSHGHITYTGNDASLPKKTTKEKKRTDSNINAMQPKMVRNASASQNSRKGTFREMGNNDNDNHTVSIEKIVSGFVSVLIGIGMAMLAVYSQFFAAAAVTTTGELSNALLLSLSTTLSFPIWANVLLFTGSAIAMGLGAFFIYKGATATSA